MSIIQHAFLSVGSLLILAINIIYGTYIWKTLNVFIIRQQEVIDDCHITVDVFHYFNLCHYYLCSSEGGNHLMVRIGTGQMSMHC